MPSTRSFMGLRSPGQVGRLVMGVTAVLALSAGCAGLGTFSKSSGKSSGKASSTVSDSDFGRLGADQTKPADAAREQLALARDELGRAKLNVVNDQHEGELARSDQGAASADISRAETQSKIAKESNEPDQLQQARDDTRTSQQGKEAANARLAYSKKLARAQAAQVTAAERKVDLMTEKVNLAKLQSLDDAGIPAAQKYDRATATQQVVDAQAAYDSATSTASTASSEASAAKENWQHLESNKQR